MTADQGPTVQSAILRAELLRLRKEKGLTQEEVAHDLEWSPSKLIRVEGGRSAITKVDLDALLTRYGVTSDESRAELQDLNRGARAPAWWAPFKAVIRGGYLEYVGYEAGATVIRQFPGSVIPGLLQTREYALALTASAVDAADVAPIVNLRMRRQEELAQRSPPPRQYYVIDEAAIRRHVGVGENPAIMPTQLRSIADTASADDHIAVRVIPFITGAHEGLSGAFTLLEFGSVLSDVLYLDAGRAEDATIVDDPKDISDYTEYFTNMFARSLEENESLEFIRNAADEMSL